jgi:hypothetical protein
VLPRGPQKHKSRRVVRRIQTTSDPDQAQLNIIEHKLPETASQHGVEATRRKTLLSRRLREPPTLRRCSPPPGPAPRGAPPEPPADSRASDFRTPRDAKPSKGPPQCSAESLPAILKHSTALTCRLLESSRIWCKLLCVRCARRRMRTRPRETVTRHGPAPIRPRWE